MRLYDSHSLRQITRKALPLIIVFVGLANFVYHDSLNAQEQIHNELTAIRITQENAATLVKGGPDSIGGIGDWHLSNGIICAIISSVEHEHEFSANGGALVDLGFCNRADDHYTFNQDLLNGSRETPINATRVTSETTKTSANIVVYGTAAGVETQTNYRVTLTEPTRLHISKHIKVVDVASANFNLLSLGSFNYHSLEPFIFNSKQPNKSLGFENIDFVTRGSAAIGEAANDADTIIIVSPPDARAPISYGWHLKSALRRDGDQTTHLPRYVLADEEAIAFMVLADSFWIGDGSKIGLLQLPQIPLLTVSNGTQLQFEEVIYLGDEASVASITDQIMATQPLVKGSSRLSNSALHIHHENGAPYTHIRVKSEGEFQFRAPLGSYTVNHVASAGRSTQHNLTVSKQSATLPDLTLPQAATLTLPTGEAMRLVFTGINETPAPNFADHLTGFSVYDGETATTLEPLSQIFLAGVDSDPSSIEIAPGNYRVYATRGPEFSIEQTDISIAAGQTKPLIISVPKRVLNTPGFIAADLHVHAGNSFDNTFSNQERVRTFVAEYGEVMVNTEHDVLVDFNPFVQAMSLTDKIAVITGMEMTSLLPSAEKPYTGGHVNFFPFTPQPLKYRNGMPAHESLRLREVLHNVRQANAKTLAQLNHPRRNLSLSDDIPNEYAARIDNGAFLDHMGVGAFPYNPNTPLTEGKNQTLIDADPITGARDLDIDAIELINPGGIYHDERIEAVRRDWMSFILQGERITGTANSDSHHARQQVALPRNMVAVTQDSVTNFDRDEFLNAIKRGNVFGTTGPMLELNLDGALMGDTLSAHTAVLELKVSSASWIPVTTAHIQVNGQTVSIADLSEKRHWQIPLSFTKDSLVTVEVFGSASPIYQTIYPNLKPYAFSNPIRVDANQDGIWQAPGLPSIN